MPNSIEEIARGLTDEMAVLFIERRGIMDRLRRCDDLFGKMLLTGKLKSLDRRIDALRTHLQSRQP